MPKEPRIIEQVRQHVMEGVVLVSSRSHADPIDLPRLLAAYDALRAAPPTVRVLDEWRVVAKAGQTHNDRNSLALAQKDVEWLNTSSVWANYAPFRVMRVALVEVPDAES